MRASVSIVASREISLIAPVGQVSAQAPHDTHADSRKPSSAGRPRCSLRSRGPSPSARTRPGSRRTRARSARRRCTAPRAARGRGGAGPARPRARRPASAARDPGRRHRATRRRARARSPAPADPAAPTARARPSPPRSAAPSRRSCRSPCRRDTSVVQAGSGPGAPVDADHAHAARAERLLARVVAQRRHVAADARGRPRARSCRARPRPACRRSRCSGSCQAKLLGKCASRLRIGAGMPPPCAHSEPSSSVSSSASSDTRSTGASPANSSCARRRPMRQGKHLPQLSSAPKCSRCSASARMSVVSSKATMPPWPSMQPTLARSSKSKGVSSSEAGRIPPSGPPICSALIVCPSRRPPARSSHSSRIVVPNATS